MVRRMCDGSVASAAPPISLPLGQVLIPTVPRQPAAGEQAASTAPQAPGSAANPNLGKHVDISA
jgi:hypothetical protein